MEPCKKLLFVCSHNKWRSLTAETMYKNFPGYEVRSAGTDPGARVRITAGHIGWANLIFVMDTKHVEVLRRKFADALQGKSLICLRISDRYEYMDRQLIELLKQRLQVYIAVPD